MSPRVITGIVSFCAAGTGIVLANLFLTMMVGEINRKRQEGNLVSYFGFDFMKVERIFSEYRRWYPSGALHLYASTAFAVAVVGLVITMVCIGIIG